MELEVFTTQGLGDNSYLLVSGDEAVLIDPQRDAWRFLSSATATRAKLRYVAETHVHNDYISGAMEARAATGAEIAAPARGNYGFPHRPMAEGDDLVIGDHRLVAIETPGHTPEHIAWLVYQAGVDDPIAAFTGGSLIVGSAGRTDLLGPDMADELTRAQFHTVRRLAKLPNATRILPTHGAGSFCVSASTGGERTSTIGDERRGNVAMRVTDEQLFVAQQLTGLSRYPAYYPRMAPINRAGPPVLGRLPAPPALGADAFHAKLRNGNVWAIDARPRREFAASHIPGAVNVEMDKSFASYVGWVVPFNAPLVLVLPNDHEVLDEAIVQLLRIGFDRVEGYLEGGRQAWIADGRPTRSYPVASIDELCAAVDSGEQPYLLDVRQPGEWDEMHADGSQHLFIGDLPARMAEVPKDREIWTICFSGYRASIAASLLDRSGLAVRLVYNGGVPDLIRRCPAVLRAAA